jgi:hypothetical protein
MLKKMMLLAMAVGALIAFAAPTVAQAELTGVEKGDTIIATSTNLRTTTAGGTLFCKHVQINAEVTGNGATATAQTTSVTTNECSVEQNGAPVIITSASAGEISLGGEAGTAQPAFVDDIPAAFLAGCELSGEAAVTYVSGTDVISIPKPETPNMAGGATDPAGCANAGFIEGDLTVTDGEGNPVLVD